MLLRHGARDKNGQENIRVAVWDVDWAKRKASSPSSHSVVIKYCSHRHAVDDDDHFLHVCVCGRHQMLRFPLLPLLFDRRGISNKTPPSFLFSFFVGLLSCCRLVFPTAFQLKYSDKHYSTIFIFCTYCTWTTRPIEWNAVRTWRIAKDRCASRNE